MGMEYTEQTDCFCPPLPFLSKIIGLPWQKGRMGEVSLIQDVCFISCRVANVIICRDRAFYRWFTLPGFVPDQQTLVSGMCGSKIV